jgi:TPR repeat protein
VKAFYWNRKAASQGVAEAGFNLGTFYAGGLSVPVDYVKACALTNLAVMQDHKYEKYRYNLVSMEMTASQVAAARELSRKMLRVGVIEALGSAEKGAKGIESRQ